MLFLLVSPFAQVVVSLRPGGPLGTVQPAATVSGSYSGSTGPVSFSVSGGEFVGSNTSASMGPDEYQYDFIASSDHVLTVSASTSSSPLTNTTGAAYSLTIAPDFGPSQVANGTDPALSASSSLDLGNSNGTYHQWAVDYSATNTNGESVVAGADLNVYEIPVITLDSNLTSGGTINLQQGGASVPVLFSGQVHPPGASISEVVLKNGTASFGTDFSGSVNQRTGDFNFTHTFSASDFTGPGTTSFEFVMNYTNPGSDSSVSPAVTSQMLMSQSPTIDFQVIVAAAVPVGSLNIYPTESNFTNIQLNYQGQNVLSAITVQAQMDASFPAGLVASFRPAGAAGYQEVAQFNPDPSGMTAVRVNVTLHCAVGTCTQLPESYELSVYASAGGYSQVVKIPLELLKAKWLVMLYSAADTGPKGEAGDLENAMGLNVVEMATVSKANNNPSVGMLVLFDAGWAVTFPNIAPGTVMPQPSNTIRLYQVANGTIRQVGADWAETDASDPATLHKFLENSIALIPADRNQLILSDHGGGIEGYAWDYRDNGNHMSIPGIVTALYGITPKLDILSFDACLMAQVEVLYQLRSYATYFTASERTVPGPGYDYTGFLTSLLGNPDQSTLDYLNVIVSTYGAKYAGSQTATLAAIDPSQLDGVVSGLNSLSGLLVQQYAANDAQFNDTMLQILAHSVYADAGRPYVDIRSLAQNIINSPGITDQGVKDAAASLIQATKAAVIANTTTGTNSMYEGLTVLLWWKAGIPKADYQQYLGLDQQLRFTTVANWLPLVQNVNRSQVVSTIDWILLVLAHNGHQLLLNVYDSSGEHTGVNPALVNASRTETELIPGSIYLDFGNGTTVIALPSSVGSFNTVVDGSAMTEVSEPYSLAYTVVQNGAVTSTKTVQGTMSQYTLQTAPVSVSNGGLSVGSTTVSGGSQTTTSSQSSTTTPAGSSTSSGGGGGIPEFPVQPFALIVLSIFVAAAYFMIRRKNALD